MLNVTREMQIEILGKFADAIYLYTAYPKDHEFEKVACGLIEKHPCLREPGPGLGFQGWKMSLKFKMGNYRQKLRSAGCEEVNINRRSRSAEVRGIKRPRRAEINFIPDYPDGQNAEDLERERVCLVEELKKKHINMVMINLKMDHTFPLRRREIIEDAPLVFQIKDRWPGLFLEQQVSQVFPHM